MTFLFRMNSPVGMLTLASDGVSLTGLWMEGQKHFASTAGPDAVLSDCAVFGEVRQWLSGYFAQKRPDPGALPLNPQGTEFRLCVWRELQRIPYGKTVTYGELARRLGSSPRAVGQAVGHNPIGILIPCHRVLGANTALTGYAAGLPAKEYLLRLEGILPASRV